MSNVLHLSKRAKVNEERGAYFDRTTWQAPFSGVFNAEAIRKALQPDYTGCLYRPITIDSVRLVSPGLVEWQSASSIGD